jgi:hypothetical protein
VDEREAVRLTDDKLREGGITNEAHREKILAIIDALLAQYESTRTQSDDSSVVAADHPRESNDVEDEAGVADEARVASAPKAAESPEETEARRLEIEKKLRHYETFQRRLAKVLAGDTDKQRAARVSGVFVCVRDLL